jgi:hypothetical protein
MQPQSCKRVFFALRAGNVPPSRKSGQRLIASGRAAIKEQSPLRGAPASVLTLRLVSGFLYQS